MVRRIYLLLLLAFFACAADAEAQRPQAAPLFTAENVNASSGPGGTIVVTYDLVAANRRLKVSIALEASEDGGQTWPIRPRAVSGDVGTNVTVGPGKRIVWEAGKDLETFTVEQFRFRVIPMAPARQNAVRHDPIASSVGVVAVAGMVASTLNDSRFGPRAGASAGVALDRRLNNRFSVEGDVLVGLRESNVTGFPQTDLKYSFVNFPVVLRVNVGRADGHHYRTSFTAGAFFEEWFNIHDDRLLPGPNGADTGVVIGGNVERDRLAFRVHYDRGLRKVTLGDTTGAFLVSVGYRLK